MDGSFNLTHEGIDRFVKEKHKELNKLRNGALLFAEAVLSFIATPNLYDPNDSPMLKTYFNKQRKVEDGFSKDEYKALEFLLGSERAKSFEKIWLRSTDYIYMQNYSRRSFRTKQYSYQYFKKNLMKLKAFIFLDPDDSLQKFLDSKESNILNMVVPDLIALAVDERDSRVIEKIRGIIYENSGVLRREIISGLLMSHSVDAYKMVADLLVAARLQEGLRQSIFETMDEGSRDGFLYLLKIILDNDMTRFSSFRRALGTWTGLLVLADDERMARKCATLIYACLSDKAERDRCLNSEDAVEIYISLWSYAFSETADILECKQKLLASGEKHKKLCLLYFAANTYFKVLQEQLAFEMLEKESDPETLGWAVLNLFGGNSLSEIYHFNEDYALANLKSVQCKNAGTVFQKLLAFLEGMKKDELKFEKSVFPWLAITVSKAAVLEKMFFCAYLRPGLPREIFIKYRDKMSIGTRCHFVAFLLNKPKDSAEKEWLLSFLADKATNVRYQAMKIAENTQLGPKDYELIEGFLKYKNGDMRKSCIKLLLKQEGEGLKASAERLLASGNEEKRLAGLEIIAGYKKGDPEFAGFADTAAKESSSDKALIYAEKAKKEAFPGRDRGFGLFDPFRTYKAILPALPRDFKQESVFFKSAASFTPYIERLKTLIDERRGSEYEVEQYDGRREKVIFGTGDWLRPFTSKPGKASMLEDYPFSDVWRTFLKESGLTAGTALGMLYCLERRIRAYFDYEPWFLDLEKEYYPKDVKDLDALMKRCGYQQYIRLLFRLLLSEFGQEERFGLSKNALLHILGSFPEYHLKSKPEAAMRGYYRYGGYETRVPSTHFIKFWLKEMKTSAAGDESFEEFFDISHYIYERSDFYETAELTPDDYARALKAKLIDENELFCELTARPHSKDRISELTRKKYPRESREYMDEEFMEKAKRAVDRIIDIEMSRGDLDTEVTKLACSVQRCSGAKHFVEILRAIGSEPFKRGYDYFGSAESRGSVLSHLIRNCHPGKGDDEAVLKSYLSGSAVSDKRLLEAAMYAPQWIDIVEKYLGWEGLASACWYFHAHLNEVFPEEKIPVVARYSPLEPLQFRDGSFDIDWFREAYETLGENRFRLVYDAAKYISRGANHRRSQLFADAALARLNINDIEKRVTDSRNRDHLLAYSIIPIEGDLAHRYDFIQSFKKESAKYGAQRRASEGRAVEIAMENLARNAGYPDVSRLVWNMETDKAREFMPLFEPQAFDGVEAFIAIEETGKPKLRVSRSGKELSAIPAALKKNEQIVRMKEAAKTLQLQFQRAREILEHAMESGDEFIAEELNRFSLNPVLSRLIQNLVFICDKDLGFFADGNLRTPDGEAVKLEESARLHIAHPVDLYESGLWAEFQKYLFDKQIVQPFKQVFRELYLPNEDELSENTISRRYAGYQIQPQKAGALLKTRRWTAGYEEGIQKIYYRENIAVQLYGAIDWFSPADIEAPALEGLGFFDRRTYKSIPISEVPKLIFSEVMRDVDMVVSVAHAGGVDPEASLSTVEMRSAITREIVRLMKLENVVLKGSHALINGKYGEYTVHLGSGIVHKMAYGAVNIIPVHGQQRGRIFLPFIDDDPRTAEITTKILFLAEDQKIKDPSILNQIAGGGPTAK